MKNTLNTEFPDVGAAQFHIRLTEGQIAPYVLLPGAPERVELVKKQWENAVDLEFNREFRSAKGTYDGMDIACVSTGIGTTSAEICLHELKNIGAHTTVRIGTTGAISECFQPGDLIIPVAAIRADGTSDCYVDKAFPAVFVEAAEQQKLHCAAGILPIGVEPRGYDPGDIAHQNVSGPEVIQYVGKYTVPYSLIRPVIYQQPRCAADGRRGLGYQLFGQVVEKVACFQDVISP